MMNTGARECFDLQETGVKRVRETMRYITNEERKYHEKRNKTHDGN